MMSGRPVAPVLVLWAALAASAVRAAVEVGGVHDARTLWRRADSPFVATKDVLVTPTGLVEVEAGVVVRFAPGVGITVRGGRIMAKGTPADPVVLTTTEERDARTSARAGGDDGEHAARLVDGPAPWEGRLQLFHKGHWRAVCTNSRNWTLEDLGVACAQMGWSGGEYAEWYPWLNGTRRMLYQSPVCTGTEESVQQCSGWAARAMGAGICEEHADLAVRCRPAVGAAGAAAAARRRHWRGLRLEWAAHSRRLAAQASLYRRSSHSQLQHVQLLYAGVAADSTVHAALEVLGVPPLMEGLTVRNSAGGGVNVTAPDARVLISNCTIHRNHGIGIYVNSSTGDVHVRGCRVTANGADGVRYEQHRRLWPRREVDGTPVADFCSSGTIAQQIFPIYTVAQQFAASQRPVACQKRYSAPPGQRLTVNFLYTENQHDAPALLGFHDGTSSSAPLIAAVQVRNGTRVQSVVTTRHHLLVTFTASNGSRVQAYMSITAGSDKAADLTVTDSDVSSNGGRGIGVHQLRSLLHVHGCTIANNSHAAGLHVLGGAGDVNITHCNITDNSGDGVNVTYGGGAQNVSWCRLTGNAGRGLSLWYNDSRTTQTHRRQLVLAYSQLAENRLQAVFVGNFCRGHMVNISGNTFENCLDDAMDIWTCQRRGAGLLRLQIGHNRFVSNSRLAVNVAPLANVEGVVEHNYWTGHRTATLRLYSGHAPHVEALPVHINVTDNRFERNSGLYVVNIGASQHVHTPRQRILFSRNFLLDNSVSEPFPTLLPRGRVSAVVTVSSASAVVYRNILQNPDSPYELGVHFEDQSMAANGSHNWFGYKRSSQVYSRIFDRKDRYNLAKVEFEPFLLSENDPGSALLSLNEQFVPHFGPNADNEIGGEISGQVVLPEGTFSVTRDIFVRPGGRLTIAFGVRLEFQQSVGMLVAGHLHAEGSSMSEEKRVTLTLQQQPQRDNTSLAPVRLVGGRTEREGRLQVLVDNEWGTVCDHGWSIDNAALVCRQLGLVLNPLDWRIEPHRVPLEGLDSPVLISDVRCGETDTDVRHCRHVTASELERTCSHQRDVALRCYPVSWAGLRLAPPAEKSILKYVWIEHAGLFDHATHTFAPALRIDWNRHLVESVVVADNDADGISIKYTDIFKVDDVNRLRSVQSRSNGGHGLSLSTLRLRLTDCLLEENGGSGIHYSGSLGRAERRELMGWAALVRGRRLSLPGDASDAPVELDLYQPTYVVTENAGDRAIDAVLHFTTSRENVIGVQVLNPPAPRATDDLYIYDFHRVQPGVQSWQLRRDQLAFPLASSSYHLTVRYRAGGGDGGDQGDGTVLVLTAVRRSDVREPLPTSLLRPELSRGRTPRLRLHNTLVRKNRRGISAHFYSRYYGEQDELRLRVANSSIEVYDSEISGNVEEAVLVVSPEAPVAGGARRDRAPPDGNAPETQVDSPGMAEPVGNVSEVTLVINRTRLNNNGAGIRQAARDIRISSVLFHWVLDNTTVTRGRRGGLQLSLPYVWCYNENFTHSVYVADCAFQDNRRFAAEVGGHFALLRVLRSQWTDNVCAAGLLAVRGMEKQMTIADNVVRRNTGDFMLDVHVDSHSEILGHVSANITGNEVRFNEQHAASGAVGGGDGRASHVVGVRGVQPVNVTHNLFGRNRLDYELVAGLHSSSLAAELQAHHNWWGSREPRHIRERIFDFDDWNSYAIARFSPFLASDSLEASLESDYDHHREQHQQLDPDNLGGRIDSDITLRYRAQPYTVRADISVMPGAVLRVEPGVTLEFYPSVGMLVLGTLLAEGTPQRRITLRPVSQPDQLHHYRVGRAASSAERPSQLWPQQDRSRQLRVCTPERCRESGDDGDDAADGFLELFNSTTLQWTPVCDSHFSERNAQVVCRQLGRSVVNVRLRYGRRYELHAGSLSRLTWWPPAVQCSGTEPRLADCPLRPGSAAATAQHAGCHWQQQFVYVHCGAADQRASRAAWGGVRFAPASFEVPSFFERVHDAHTHRPVAAGGRWRRSQLRYVDVVGAGWLHGEQSPAVLSVLRSPQLLGVNVTGSLSDGVTVLNPTASLDYRHLWIHKNLGVGLSAVLLTGEARSAGRSSFQPLKQARLPYNLFGVVDMCDAHKEVFVQERVLVYYRYDSRPVDCVKIFTSHTKIKTFGFRLLQFSLVNDTAGAAAPLHADQLRLYDGDIYNVTARRQLALLTAAAAGADVGRLYVSQLTSLSVQLHTGGGAGLQRGFVAELVTLPVSSIGFSRDVQHNISHSEFSSNDGGAISYVSAGELSPTLTLAWNRLLANGRRLYGNFSSSRAAVLLDVQNTRHLYCTNNIMRDNQGGLWVRAGSSGLATALKAYIYSNVFSGARGGPTLYVEGRHASPYQEAVLYYNYFTGANATYHSVLQFQQVVANFSYNIVHGNRGRHVLTVNGFRRVHLPVYQTFAHNGIWENYATNPEERSTVVAGGAGQQYSDNVFVNPDNDYELATVNRTQEDLELFRNRHRLQDVWRAPPLDARHNWWGYNRSLAIQGRIKDKLDGQGLLRVDFSEYHLNNASLLSGGGRCWPGWQMVDSTCLLYVPAPMTFSEAKQFCLDQNGSMPYLRADGDRLVAYIRAHQQHYDWRLDRVWVQHLDVVTGCSLFVRRRVLTGPCHLQLPFLCEMDGGSATDRLGAAWTRDTVLVAVVACSAAALLCLCCVAALWLVKSRHRHREKLHRRNSIRGSQRSTRSLASSFSDVSSAAAAGRGRAHTPHHLHPMPERAGAAAAAAAAAARAASVDSMAKSPLDETRSSYDDQLPTAAASCHTFDSSYSVGGASAGYQLTGYENRAYVDRSALTSRAGSPWEPPGGGGGGGSGGSDSTLEFKRPLPDEDEDAASDTIAVYEGVAAQPAPAPARTARSADPFPLYGDSVGSDDYFQQGRTRSQPLETAM